MRLIYLFIIGFLFHTGPAVAQSQTAPNFSVLLGAFETEYVTWGRHRNRAHNIQRAASIISTVEIVPGGWFSFNEVVGPRTAAAGFQEAPVILNGRVSRGLGGGICQVASTIHAAVLRAGLYVEEMHPHSRPSTYIGPGLDATVNYGTKDLIVRNPYLFSIQIVVSVEEGNKLLVRVFGQARVFDVRVRIFTHVMEDFETILVEDDNLAPGQTRIEESGTPKLYVRITREMTPLAPNISPETEMREFVYFSSNRIVRVGTISAD
jgi:vancomycin resistance protein YoaR